MGIIEYFGLRRPRIARDQELQVLLDAADLLRLDVARRTLEQAAVTDDDRSAITLLSRALLELQGVTRQDHARVVALRLEIDTERAGRTAVDGDEGSDGSDGSDGGGSDDDSAQTTPDEPWDQRWEIIVVAENELGWDKARVPVADLKDPLWIRTGPKDFQHAFREQLDLKSSEPWMLEGKPYIWAIAQDAKAIEQLIAHPEPKEDIDSDEEPEGFVAMTTEEFHPERKGEGELVNYSGEEPPQELDLPAPFQEQGAGESTRHAYKKVAGMLYGKDEMRPTDVVQGLGNCYFMGSIAALTTSPAGRALLKQRVSEIQGAEPDSEGKITAWLPVMSRKNGGEILMCAGRGASADDPPPLWPALLEQQHARRQGGYKNADGGTAEAAFQQLGIKAETLEVLRMPAGQLKEWFLLRREQSLVMGTPKSYGGAPSGGRMERIPFRALAFLYCEDLQAEIPKRLKVRPDATGAIEFDGKTIAHLLDDDGKAPADDPAWVSKPVQFVSDELAGRFNISCMPKFENPRRLSPAHLYTVTRVHEHGVDVWDQLAKTSLTLSYDEVSASIRTVTVALVT